MTEAADATKLSVYNDDPRAYRRNEPRTADLRNEAPLHRDERPAPAARPKGGGYGADAAPADLAVGGQGEDVAGQHVHPAQAAPTLRPHRPLAVVGHGAGHLFDPHVRPPLGPPSLSASPAPARASSPPPRPMRHRVARAEVYPPPPQGRGPFRSLGVDRRSSVHARP